MFRLISLSILTILLLFAAFLGIKGWLHAAKKETPLFLQHSTFLEGTGIKTLGKRFLLRYTSDRILFSTAKNRLKKQRASWNTGKRFSIPKVIHVLWLSSDPIPEYVEHNKASIQQLNPNCRLIVWDQATLKKRMTAKEARLFDSIPPELQKVYATAFILYYDGGAVLDSNIQCLSSFEEVLLSGDWIATFEPPLQKSEEKKRLILSSAFFAAIPHHPLTKKWVLAMDAYFFSKNEPSKNIKQQYLEGMMLPLMNLVSSDIQETDSFYILPATCFSPIAPQFIQSYLRKLTGEDSKEKKKIKRFFSQKTPPFSKIARCSFGMHLKGGTLADISSEDKKDRDPF